MALAITDIYPKLRTKIFDLSKLRIREPIGVGDGSQDLFYLDYPPIQADSQKVFLDGVFQTENTHYAINDDEGEIDFVTPPTLGQKVEVTYRGIYISVTDMESIVTNAVEELSLIYTNQLFSVDSSDNITPTPTQSQQWLIILQARLSVVRGEAEEAARNATRFARTGMSVDTTRRAEFLNQLCDKLQADLEKKSTRITLTDLHADQDVEIMKW